nr:zinc finger, CCHC-type [Tanacetum cinerariifolium]
MSPWKGVVRFRKKGKLAPRFFRPFVIVEIVGPVAYLLDLPEEMNGVQDTFHVSNLKKCLADLTLEFKKVKRSRIAIVKVRWNSKREPEFTWEHEDQMKLKSEEYAYLSIYMIVWNGWVRLPSICVVIGADGYAYPGAISWASKMQTCITSPTMEFKFVTLVAVGRKAKWLKNPILEIPSWPKPITPISNRCDNAATLEKENSQMSNGRSRHLGFRHNMIHELTMNEVISIEFVRSLQNLAHHPKKGLNRY